MEFMTGCLPRKSLCGKVVNIPSLEDKMEMIPLEKWAAMIGETSNKRFVKNIFYQNPEGSCAAESTTGAMMAKRIAGGQQHVVMNPWTQFWFTGQPNHKRGSSIDDNLSHSFDVGCIPEALQPRSKGLIKPDPALIREVAPLFRIDEVFDIETILGVGTALLKDFLVVFGWKGHSCFLCELLSPIAALYVNSWGADWGDAGFGMIDLADINFSYGAFAVRSVVDSGEVDPSWLQMS